ncbi:MAG: hypothetical protein ACLSBH_13060 [Coprobacillus cateniformis]
MDGKQAFCMEHPTATPGTGTKLTSNIYYNNDVRKGTSIMGGKALNNGAVLKVEHMVLW